MALPVSVQIPWDPTIPSDSTRKMASVREVQRFTFRWLGNSIRSSNWLPIKAAIYRQYIGNIWEYMGTPSSLQQSRSIHQRTITLRIPRHCPDSAGEWRSASTAAVPRGGTARAPRGGRAAPPALRCAQGRHTRPQMRRGYDQDIDHEWLRLYEPILMDLMGWLY